MTIGNQDPSHRRSATRAPVDRPIKLQFDDSMDVIEGHCRNISIGGMFILFDNARPAGSLVRFELEVAGDNAIRGLGEVVWMRARSEFGGPEAGFGLKFRFLEQRDRQLIFKLVSQHIKQRLSRRQPVEARVEESLEPAASGVDQPPEQGSVSPSIAIPPEPEVPPPAVLPAEPEHVSSGAVAPEFEAPPPAAAPPEPEAPPFLATPPEGEILPPTDDLPEAAPEPAEYRPAPGDLDPSAGETPIYELGLESETRDPRSDLFSDEELARPVEAAPPPAGSGASPPPAALPDHDGAAEHRDAGGVLPVTRAPREFSILPVLLVLALAGGVGFYLFKDTILGRPSGEPPPVVAASGTPADEANTADRGMPPAPEATSGAVSSASPEPANVEPAGVEATAVAETSAPPSSETVPPPPPPAHGAPAPPPHPDEARPGSAPAAPARAFSRLEDISWSEAPGGLKVVLRTNGAIPRERYRSFYLAGAEPRAVVRLIGVDRQFGDPELSVGGPAVRRIRTGFHRKGGRNEQHVVIDLLGPQWRINDLRSRGSDLELLIGEEQR